MNDTQSDLVVANTIAQQIGARAFFMMGTRFKLADGKSLVFDVRGSQRVNRVKVILDASDTYTVEFSKFRKLRSSPVASHSGVYDDMLHPIIEKETGLRLSL
jgi:hypothetical protein